VLDAAPLPFATGATLHFPDQAQFNPAHYLLGLARAARDEGALLFENTRVTGFEHGKRWRVDFGRHRVHADAVIMATALPINKPGRFDLWTQPRCHVAMAFRMTDETAIDGMFIGVDDPTHSLRMARDAGGPLLVALGPKFATGHDADVAQRFRDLAAWARREMGAGAARWHWANEDYDTPDGVPFVGAPKGAAKGYHVATGFNGWGITNGTAAGLTIADLIGGIANPWAALYDPTRAAAKTINRGGDTKSRVTSVAAIARGEGGVIMQGKNPVAVYRPAKGRAIARSASCTHLGCTVTWNNADKTWDCPCHGSIFSAEGEVIHGPAAEPLGKAKVPKG
jgi:glycine/D-amino acid oxidase-like deaminating enzyme/nitrite reductase/ring-hydroxylating ferredoxin subunit